MRNVGRVPWTAVTRRARKTHVLVQRLSHKLLSRSSVGLRRLSNMSTRRKCAILANRFFAIRSVAARFPPYSIHLTSYILRLTSRLTHITHLPYTLQPTWCAPLLTLCMPPGTTYILHTSHSPSHGSCPRAPRNLHLTS